MTCCSVFLFGKSQSKEQIDKVCDMHHEEIDPVKANLEKAQGDLQVANEKVSTNESSHGTATSGRR